MKRIAVIFFFLKFLCGTHSQEIPATADPPFMVVEEGDEWVQRTFNSMSPEERLAQLFFVEAYSNRGKKYNDSLIRKVQQLQVGGVIFFQGGPARQAILTNALQDGIQVPLLIAMDAEWGLGMRLDSIENFPYQMTLGAIQDNDLIRRMGETIGSQMKRNGVHINYAPVVDVNNNPKNPVINIRSFGSNSSEVASKAIAYMKGLQSKNVLATAKHFPGHGNTDTDSHLNLPVIHSQKEQLDTVELLPFKELIWNGIGSIMVAHLEVPAIQTKKNVPTSMDSEVVHGLLKDTLGFSGLVVTDALNMQGATKTTSSSNIELEALLAGNDALLYTKDVRSAIKRLGKAVLDGKISQSLIDEKCLNLLRLKKWAGLDQWSPIPTANLVKEINNDSIRLQIKQLYANSITLLVNRQDEIPAKNLETLRMASVSVGVKTSTPFQSTISKYTRVDHFTLSSLADSTELNSLLAKLIDYDRVIVGIHASSILLDDEYGITSEMRNFVNTVCRTDKAIVVGFMNAYAIDKFEDLTKARSLLLTYQDNEDIQHLAAQAVFAGIPISGKLPVQLKSFNAGAGIQIKNKVRLGYGQQKPMDFSQIDSLIEYGIQIKAFPGCQLLIAKNGNVIYEKAYGHHSYADTVKVKTTDLYDIASLTKIIGPLPLLMQLWEAGRLPLDKPWKTYFPLVKNSPIGDLSMRDILTHQAGFPSEVKLWKTLFAHRTGGPKRKFIHLNSDRDYNYALNSHMFLNIKKYRRKAYRKILKVPIEKNAKYIYSGVPFLLFPELIMELTSREYEEVITERLFEPLGMYHTIYNPLGHFEASQIVPTEFDIRLRNKLVHGEVHDENAMALGGVSGNAGLFSNANDLGKIFQLYLNLGTYGGQTYLKKGTIQEFTKHQFCNNGNRRGLGFDKPECNGISDHVTDMASQESYGHTGFTGTYAWADPGQQLIYIFLSNRVYPSRMQREIYIQNLRNKIHEIIYEKTNEL